MQTPNDYLRELLLELIEESGLNDSEIARAYTIAHAGVEPYAGDKVDASRIWNFRNVPPVSESVPPKPAIEEAVAAATGTTRAQNWDEAYRRWSEAMTREAGSGARASGARAARRRSA